MLPRLIYDMKTMKPQTNEKGQQVFISNTKREKKEAGSSSPVQND